VFPPGHTSAGAEGLGQGRAAGCLNTADAHVWPHVADGANVDGTGDYRPGMRAAAEFGVSAPRREAGVTEAEIRALARARGIEIGDKPAAPCLSSRRPFGTPVTLDALGQIEQSERVLRDLGFAEVRVRHHGQTARIEVPVPEIPRLAGVLPHVTAALRAIGFREVAVAPDGLRSGRFSAALASRGAPPGGARA